VEDHLKCSFTIPTQIGGNSSDMSMIILSTSKMTRFLMYQEAEIKKLTQFKYGRRMDQKLKLGNLSTPKMLLRSKPKD
jgi:hypothetical protein